MQPFRARLPGLEALTSPIQVGESSYQVRFEGEDGWVIEVRRDSSSREFPIRFALGGKNVYYFLTDLERGRLQVLPVAFDVREKAWFDTTASMVRHFHDRSDEALDWRESPLTFNTSCHGCHVSRLSSNYDPIADRYQTTWHEPGISCETCHGPGAAHVEACREAPPGTVPEDLRIISTASFSVTQANDSCAPCHAKMFPLTEAYPPGAPFFDHFGLVALEDPDFYPDGRDLGENYTWTHWLMNPCAASGELSCLHCHTSSGRDRHQEDPDQACMPCHEGYVRDPSGHTFHRPESSGSRCVACHMPATTFARMVRHDHTLWPPVPAATLEFGSPNACNLCHEDQSPEWSDRWSRRWWGRYQEPYLKRARLVDAARRQDWSRLPQILQYLRDQNRNQIFAASLIRLLAGHPDPLILEVLLGCIDDPSPLVRAAAASSLAAVSSGRERDALLRAASDSSRVVRVSAAAQLAGLDASRLAPNEARAMNQALAEYRNSLQVRPDHWTSPYNLGNLYLETGRLTEALAAFDRAARLRPDLAAPRVNGALALARLGRSDDAGSWLRTALRADPENTAAHYNLGLLLAEQGRPGEAAEHLKRAAQGRPPVAEAAVNLAVLLGEQGNREALAWAERAHVLQPSMSRAGYVLAYYLSRFGDPEGAVGVLRKLVAQRQADVSGYLLLVELLQGMGRPEEARRLCLEAATDERLTAEERAWMRSRAQSR